MKRLSCHTFTESGTPKKARKMRLEPSTRSHSAKTAKLSAMPKLTKEQADLLREPFIAFVATVMPDGSPQVTPVWVDTDGENVLFNTARGRVKDLNLKRDPRIAISVVDPAAPDERALAVRGVAEMTEEGAKEHIDRLAKKYGGYDEYPWLEPGEQRVTVKIRAKSIINPG